MYRRPLVIWTWSLKEGTGDIHWVPTVYCVDEPGRLRERTNVSCESRVETWDIPPLMEQVQEEDLV